MLRRDGSTAAELALELALALALVAPAVQRPQSEWNEGPWLATHVDWIRRVYFCSKNSALTSRCVWLGEPAEW